MEARKITIVSTKTQSKKTIMSQAETLRALKSELDNNGIDYAGMTFYEGTTKTELKTDDSVLPTNVPYKGTITNELVFMLTNANKHIKSGLTYAEMKAYIKQNGLKETFESTYGKSYTQGKTSEFEECISKNTTPVTNEKNEGVSFETLYNVVQEIINVLDMNEVISTATAETFKKMLTNGKSYSENCTNNLQSSYSDDEIAKMFDTFK